MEWTMSWRQVRKFSVQGSLGVGMKFSIILSLGQILQEVGGQV